MSEYVVIEWGPKVKLAHVELTKADVICRDYAMAARVCQLEGETFFFQILKKD